MSKKNIKGATMIEYVLIVALLSIAAVILLGTVGGGVQSTLTSVSNAITPSG
jgi:Flp pilus assembly pilin Flp